ncbi:MAG: lysophospholipid acyltransferase family protein [Vicinamibacterales bacterium]
MNDWRSSPFRRIEIAAISGLGYPVIAALGRTLRWRVEGLDHLEAVAAAGHQPIIGFWHGRILPGTLYFQRRGIVVITSENFDGEWIARIIHRFGYGTARGSTSRGAKKALLRLVRDMADGKGASFTLDGPRGPARVAQLGAVWLAKATGNPIVPIHLEATSYWTLRSWDRAQIPRPFATVALAIGEPMYVPREADDAALDAARVALEGRLGTLEERARGMARSAAAK